MTQPMHTLHAADGASLSLTLQGGQPCRWRTADGRERLWLSPLADFSGATAVRGGVPVIFPQFGSLGSLQRHGFARLRRWQTEFSGVDAEGRGHVCLRLDHAPDAQFSHACTLRLEARFGGAGLEMALRVENGGDTAFSFTAALHTYLAADPAHAQLLGLEALPFLDNARHRALVAGEQESLRFVGEVDRTYLAVPGAVTLEQPGQEITVHQEGFEDVVVWNPGATVAAGLKDVPPGGWQHFVCVEAARVGRPVSLLPGQSWRGQQRVQARS